MLFFSVRPLFAFPTEKRRPSRGVPSAAAPTRPGTVYLPDRCPRRLPRAHRFNRYFTAFTASPCIRARRQPRRQPDPDSAARVPTTRPFWCRRVDRGAAGLPPPTRPPLAHNRPGEQRVTPRRQRHRPIPETVSPTRCLFYYHVLVYNTSVL